MSKIPSNSKADQAYQRLRRSLTNGEFAPGERLTEAKVARKLGLGRMPVRESLWRLEAEGLLRGRGPYGGKFVPYIEDADAKDVIARFELREAIESAAARLAARYMNGIQIGELRIRVGRVQDAQKDGDWESEMAAGMAFHEYLLANCGNPLLLTTWRMNHLQAFLTRSRELRGTTFMHLPKEQRQQPPWPAVVQAIAVHDADSAEQLTRRSLRNLTEAIRQTLYADETSIEST